MQGVKNGRVQKGFIVEVALWDAAAEICQKNKDSISEVLRAGLRAYIEANGGEAPETLIGVKAEKPAEVAALDEAKVELAEKKEQDARKEETPKPARRRRAAKPAEEKPQEVVATA